MKGLIIIFSTLFDAFILCGATYLVVQYHWSLWTYLFGFFLMISATSGCTNMMAIKQVKIIHKVTKHETE